VRFTSICFSSVRQELTKNYNLTHIYRKYRWQHRSCHNTVRTTACRQGSSRSRCRFYWPHQIKTPSQYQNSGKEERMWKVILW